MIIRQKYLKNISLWINKPMIKVITGIRRCGKSYMMKMIMDLLREQGVSDDHICYVNLERFDQRHLLDVEALYTYIKTFSRSSDMCYVFIDEVQNCKGWEKITSSLLAEDGYDVYLTGSNATMLSSDLATYIAGRYIEFNMFPLCFDEFCEFYHAYYQQQLTDDQLFANYLRYGGFPGLFTVIDDDEAKRQYLSGIRNTVILRDTVKRYDIRDVDLLERVINYVFDNIGQIFSANAVTNYLKSIGLKASLFSVNSYLQALSHAHLIQRVKRYDIKGKKIMDRLDKYYVSDLGLRYSELGYRDNDIAQMLENVVYNELRVRGYQVFVGKEGDQEVDFIANKGDERIYIQVTYLLATKEVINREYGSLLKIKDAYPKLVLSMDRLPIGVRDGIKHQYLVDFLMSSRR